MLVYLLEKDSISESIVDIKKAMVLLPSLFYYNEISYYSNLPLLRNSTASLMS